MCGIAGIYGLQNQTLDQGLLAKMNQKMIHRGPDSDGFYVHRHVGMSMRRLKVIDLSTGNQPISNEDKTLWIVFNGEIYNYRELRQDLEKRGHRFSTHSDTEVIVHLYQQYGALCLKYLIGMFGFSIYDTVKDELFIARDRLGVKPLFYTQSLQGVAYGSEIKPILEVPWVKASVDRQALSHFLSFNYLPSPWTGFQGIRQLPPGHYLRVNQSGVQMTQYWEVPLQDRCDDSEETASKKILDLMHRSMERRLIADVPIGAFLSGGLDSSTLVYFMKEHRHDKIKTFSVGFDEPGYDETPYAREVASYFGTDHHEIRCQASDAQRLLPKITWHADNLLGDQAALPLYLVSELAKKHVTVSLSGDGGDEMFVGYPTFHADHYHQIYTQIPALIRRFLIEPSVQLLPATQRKVGFDYKAKKFIQAGSMSRGKAHYWWRTIFTDAEKSQLLKEAVAGKVELDSYSVYEQYFKKSSAMSFVNQALVGDLKVWLDGNNLYKVDTMTMAHGLEARVPFLDHELVEYMTALPSDLKFRGRTLKYLQKKMMKGRLPDRIVNRKKAGFHSPIASWLKGPLHDYAKAEFSQSSAVKQYLNASYVQTLLAEHRAGRANHSFKLWNLLVLSHWHRHFAAVSA